MASPPRNIRGVTASELPGGGWLFTADSWVEKLRSRGGDEAVEAHFTDLFSRFPRTGTTAKSAACQRDMRELEAFRQAHYAGDDARFQRDVEDALRKLRVEAGDPLPPASAKTRPGFFRSANR